MIFLNLILFGVKINKKESEDVGNGQNEDRGYA